MSGAITWEMVGLIGTIFVGLLTAIAAWLGWLFKIIAGLRKEIAEIDKGLEAHKLYAANHYATKDGVNQELEKFRISLDKLIDRIDRMLVK
jgi:hypothetical protein